MKIPFRLAINLLLLFLFFVLVFHICVLLAWVPKTMVWGGRIKNHNEFLWFESISIFINAILLWIILQRAKYLKAVLPHRYLNAILWVLAGLFILNTAGNLMAINALEKYLFTPITLLLAILCCRIALEKDNRN